MAISIRKMQKNDIPEVSELLCACYRWLGKKEGFSSEAVEFLVNKRGSVETITNESANEEYLVACEDNTIVGMVTVKENEIAKLYVDPAYHRRGIGRLLFESAEKIIASRGHSQIKLGALGKSPVAFYLSMGMKINGRKFPKWGEDLRMEIILMEKALTI